MSAGKEIRIDLIKIAIALQLGVFGLMGLDRIGVDTSILREIVMFFYLAFLPGMLILRLQKVNLSPTKTFLLSFGISLAFITLVFTFVNALLASIGFERPISKAPLLISISIAVLLLILMCYYKGVPQIPFLCDSQLFSSPPFLFVLLLPFVSILGIHISSIEGNVFLVLLLLAVIALIPLFVSLNKFSEKIYPLVILTCSISLTFLKFGGTIFKPLSFCPHEIGIIGVIKTVGIWVPNFGSSFNSLLPLTILYPALSILFDIDITLQVMATGYLIISFLPLIVYEIYIRFFNRKISLLSSFLFMFYPFHNALLGSRTGFAVYFLALLLLTWFSKEINPLLRNALLILFAFSIIVSHYGTAYYFMLLLFAAAIIAFLTNKSVKTQPEIAIPAFCTLYFVLTFSWYLYTSTSLYVNWAVSFGKNIYMHLSDFFSLESSATMQAVITEYGFAQEITKYLLFVNTLFIIIGVLKLVYDSLKDRKIESNYHIFALAFFLGLLTLFLPRIMGTPRIYAISLLVLSPFSFLGLSLLANNFYKVLRIKANKNVYAIFFSIFLLLLLLFGSGFVSGIQTKITDTPFDPSNPANWFSSPNEYDIFATGWLLHHPIEGRVYVDRLFYHIMYIREGQLIKGNPLFPLEYAGRKVYDIKPFRALPIEDYLEKEGDMERGSYVYLGYHNTVYNFIGTINETGERVPLKTSDYLYLFERGNRIYDNGISLIYWR